MYHGCPNRTSHEPMRRARSAGSRYRAEGCALCWCHHGIVIWQDDFVSVSKLVWNDVMLGPDSDNESQSFDQPRVGWERLS